VIIAPRATAVPSDMAETAPTQRDRPIQRIAATGRRGWQRQTRYGRRSKGETATARYKGILGGRRHARNRSAQPAEAMIDASALNRMRDSGRPASVRMPQPDGRTNRPSVSRHQHHRAQALICRAEIAGTNALTKPAQRIRHNTIPTGRGP